MSKPKGFTLVEMLVATALVVLMMLMFAQIFQTAGGLVSNQKGMAELDQNVRTLTILLRGDMKSRTFVDVVPFQAGQDTTVGGPKYIPQKRRGFFSIAENNPDDSTDDVLHLTITTETESNQSLSQSPMLPYAGRSSFMFTGATAPADQNQYLLDNPDQPEFDDGQVTINQTGSSKFAEVCWFLRNGTLYRRSLLIRDPYSRNGNPSEEPQDSSVPPVDFIATTYAGEEHVNQSTNFSGVFWRDFDYAAYTDIDNNTKFHDLKSLDNKHDTQADLLLVGFPRSLGIPFLRYGSSVSRATATQIFGPRDFLDHTDPSTFIGRFTVEESTHYDFAYPGNRMPATDPMNSLAGPALTLTDGRVNEYKYGFTLPAAHPTRAGQTDNTQRRGEDIVMSNVHSFDIQVWDDELNDFADLGHQRTSPAGRKGWYHRDFHRNDDFANATDTDPATTPNHYSYDTWHPFIGMTETPYRPLGNDPENQPDSITLPNLGLGADEEVPLRAVKIQIRFHDVGSDSMRDLTFTFPLE